MDPQTPSRRKFLAATAELASASWIAMNWPDIAAAAEHKGHAKPAAHAGHSHAAPKGAAKLKTLTAAEAAEIDAIANQIVPGGKSPGARDCHAVYFIDNALGSFFKAQLPAFRQGLTEFQAAYAAKSGGGTPFSKAPDAQQIAFLHEVDKTPFFLAVRRLTVLGIIAMPKYGGNYEGLGSKLIGVEDRHVWQPPFGYYDKDYEGFVPYPGTKTYMA